MKAGEILLKVGDFEYINQVKLVLAISFNFYFSTNIERFKRITMIQDRTYGRLNRYPCFYFKNFFIKNLLLNEKIMKNP